MGIGMGIGRGVFGAMLVMGCSGGKDVTDGTTPTTTTSTVTTTTLTTTTSTFTVPDPVGDPATIGLEGECPLAAKYGSFAVQQLDVYSTISGAIADGVVPITVLEEMLIDQDCKLLRRNNAFCDPPCGAFETCNFSEECVPFPLNQDMGTVTIGGLVEDIVMRPVVPGNQYFIAQTPHPPFDPGALVELRTWDATYGQDITLHGVGVHELSLGGNTDWVLARDTDFAVTWAPPPGTVRSHVHLRLNIDQHGTTPVSLYCQFEDVGSGTVPSSIINGLINFGVTGFPNATLTRRTVDSTEFEAGCVQFEVSSPVQPSVLVDGYIPCDSPDDCPTGQSCDPVTFICG